MFQEARETTAARTAAVLSRKRFVLWGLATKCAINVTKDVCLTCGSLFVQSSGAGATMRGCTERLPSVKAEVYDL